MFFRRGRPRAPSFDEHVQALRAAGFDVRAGGDRRVCVARGASAAIIEAVAGAPRIVLTGRLVGEEIARLVDTGFQKFWRTPDGRDIPALAEHLSELHALLEDLRETLGLASLYNTSLGTVNDLHLYDRLLGWHEVHRG
jgi:hypothetical protein